MGAEPLIPTPQSYLDLQEDGPRVVVAPAGIGGMLTDSWQRALTDAGIPRTREINRAVIVR